MNELIIINYFGKKGLDIAKKHNFNYEALKKYTLDEAIQLTGSSR